jgi:hypothetical protein
MLIVFDSSSEAELRSCYSVDATSISIIGYSSSAGFEKLMKSRLCSHRAGHFSISPVMIFTRSMIYRSSESGLFMNSLNTYRSRTSKASFSWLGSSSCFQQSLK